jgi:hypothetical protein
MVMKNLVPLARSTRHAFTLILLVSLRVVLPAAAQQPGADSTRLIEGDNPSKLEKALNEAADDGYRISRAAPERIHNAVADALLAGGHDETGGAVILMEKTPSGSANYQYAVVRLFARPSSWERDINKAASQGFRVIPGYGTLTLRQGFVLGTAQAPITIMEKAPGGSEVKEYVVAEARQMRDFEREVNQRFANGFTMMYIGQFYALHLALMEKRGEASAEERLLTAKKDEELEAKMRASATERFCIVYTQSTLEDASHGDRLAYLKKCDAAPEYIFTKNDQTARADFDKAVADGYRLVPAGIFGKAITLVKALPGERYEYRLAKKKVEADEAKKEGYTELPLNHPIWHGFVLEKKVSSVSEAPQRQ